MTGECPADAQSGESGCENAPPSPPSEHELSLIVVVGSLVEELKLTNRCLLEICNVNSLMLSALMERQADEEEEEDDGNQKPRYLGDPG